ncbi:MAG: hypothetical protein WCK90_02255 [archaeon]
MNTSVNCVGYFKKERDHGGYIPSNEFFTKPTQMGEIILPNSSKEVLAQLLPHFRLESYIEVRPWITDLSKPGYLIISEVEKPSTTRSLTGLVNYSILSVARRPTELTPSQKKELANSLIHDISPELGPSPFRSKHYSLKRAYSDILGVLGEDISEKEIGERIRAQNERLHAETMRDQMRDAQNWAALRHQKVGAETDLPRQEVLDGPLA